MKVMSNLEHFLELIDVRAKYSKNFIISSPVIVSICGFFVSVAVGVITNIFSYGLEHESVLHMKLSILITSLILLATLSGVGILSTFKSNDRVMGELKERLLLNKEIL